MSSQTTFRVADLSQSQSTAFTLEPDAATRAALAAEFDLLEVRKLRLQGQIAAQGRDDWVLTARLGATVVQPCDITLAPVTTRIDVDVRRTYLRAFPTPDGPESEMPEDDTIEPLGDVIDASAVLAEALALHLPLYPRAPGAKMGDAVYTEPGKTPLKDADLRPFAGLAALRDRMNEPE